MMGKDKLNRLLMTYTCTLFFVFVVYSKLSKRCKILIGEYLKLEFSNYKSSDTQVSGNFSAKSVNF